MICGVLAVLFILGRRRWIGSRRGLRCFALLLGFLRVLILGLLFLLLLLGIVLRRRVALAAIISRSFGLGRQLARGGRRVKCDPAQGRYIDLGPGVRVLPCDEGWRAGFRRHGDKAFNVAGRQTDRAA